jgi:antitoxin VapB
MSASSERSTAKLFMHSRSQAVRLPKEFRFEGTEVRVRRIGDQVILEPMEKGPIDLDRFWAELDAIGTEDVPSQSFSGGSPTDSGPSRGDSA